MTKGKKACSAAGAVSRPLVYMALVITQVVVPFAAPFAVGTQASYPASTPPPAHHATPRNIRDLAGVSVQMSTVASSDATTTPHTCTSGMNCGEYNATISSKLLFRYASPLVDLASKRPLEASDAFHVPPKRRMESAVPKLENIYNKCRSKAKKRIEKQKAEGNHKIKTSQSLVLLKALLLSQRRTLVLTGILRLLNTCVQAFPALLVARLLRLIESGGPPRKALGAALSLVAVLSLKMITENQYFHNVVKGAAEVRGALAGLIFDKSLRLPGGGGTVSASAEDTNKNPSSLGVGGVLNLMQSDASILEFTAMQLHTIWDGPLQIALYTTLLFQTLGPSVLYGIGVLLLTIPLNSITLRLLNRLSRYENEAKDARTKRTSESVANMKLLKLQAWEHSFEDDIRFSRNEELRRHVNRGVIRAMNNALTNAVPALVLVVTLAAYVKTGRPIVASTIFTAISLFNQLRFPLFFYPMLIDSLATGKNALTRVSSFLASEEITPYVEIQPPLAGGRGSIEMRHGNFLWSTAKPGKDGEVETSAAPALCEVNFQVNPGEVVAVVGQVGSGKSALIKGLLGELAPVPRAVVDQSLNAVNTTDSANAPGILDHPSVVSHGNIGYTSQEAWLPKGTIRDAVVFGREYDEKRYLAAIRDAGLDRDFVDNIDGINSKAAASQGVLSHDTDVGEGGSSLSGGQRARVALARALYAGDDTKVFLLDDPLSALDASVGSTVFERLTRRVRNSSAATVLVTNDPSIPRRCDRVILMGRYGQSPSCSTIIDVGTYDELLARGHDIREACSPHEDGSNAFAVDQVDGSSIEITAAKKVLRHDTIRVAGGYEVTLNDTETYYQVDLNDPEPSGCFESLPDYIADCVVPVIHQKRVTEVLVETPVESNPTASGDSQHAAIEQTTPVVKRLTSVDDTMYKGAIPLSTYVSYFKSVRKPILIVAMVLSYLMANGAQFFQQFVVAKWTEVGSLGSAGDAAAAALGRKYLQSLINAAGVVSIFLWLRSFLTMKVGVRASDFLHNRMLTSVFAAPMSFFDATPSGQILSRFGREMEVVDRALPDSIGSVIFCFLQIFLSVSALAGVITPAMMVPLFFIGILYSRTMGRFRPAARDLKGVEAKSRSPIYTQFGEAIRGTEVIRSIPNAGSRWSSQHRSLSDQNLAVITSVKSLDRWLSLRLETLGNVVVFTSAVASVFLTRSGKLKAGSAGWGLTQALSITGLLTWAVRTLTDLETNMLSVVRVEELTDLDVDEVKGKLPGKDVKVKPQMPRELAATGEGLAKLQTDSAKLHVPVTSRNETALLKSGWPWKGKVVFKNASMRYNEISPLVLKNVTLGVLPGTTLGVVGRSGSGKSSLLLTLFRLVEIEAGGTIEIDGVDIRSISLQGLRESLSIIPQDPVLFAGTVMYNLDATGKAKPEDAWAALEAASPELAQQFRIAGSGLDTYISEGGKNLSLGQRQLICLARALLRRSKVLVMDEATSSVDSKTDAQVQETIRREFVNKGVTVITVAHRLDTVLGYDNVAVLGNGQLMEYGPPNVLVRRRDGELRLLVDADRLNKSKGAKTKEETLVTASSM